MNHLNLGLHETFFHLWLVDAAYIFQAPSLEDKMRWLQNLRNTISFIALQKDTRNNFFFFFLLKDFFFIFNFFLINK